MSLVITTAVDVDEKRLVTLAKVKSRFGITSSSDDAKLTEIIDEVSQFVCDFLDSDLAKQTYTESLPGNNRTYLMLARVPLVSISTITYQGVAVTDYEIADYNSGLLYRESGWSYVSQSWSRLVHDPHPSFRKQDWSIVYDAGYTLPAGEDPDTSAEYRLPLSLRSVVYDLIGFHYRDVSEGGSVKSRVVGDMEEVYSDIGTTGVPIAIEKSLGRFKRF
jgi:hypothetical protein